MNIQQFCEMLEDSSLATAVAMLLDLNVLRLQRLPRIPSLSTPATSRLGPLFSGPAFYVIPKSFVTAYTSKLFISANKVDRRRMGLPGKNKG